MSICCLDKNASLFPAGEICSWVSFVGLMHQLEVWVFILSFYHSLIYLRAVKVSIEDEDHRHFIWMEDGLLTLLRAEETPQTLISLDCSSIVNHEVELSDSV